MDAQFGLPDYRYFIIGVFLLHNFEFGMLNFEWLSHVIGLVVVSYDNSHVPYRIACSIKKVRNGWIADLVFYQEL